MAADQSSGRRLALVGGLYFAQGVPWGFVNTALALQLAAAGASPVVLAMLLTAASLPWSFKPLAGPLVDRLATRPGTRRWLLLATLPLMAATVLLVGLAAGKTAALIHALVLAHNAFAAFADVVGDSIALDLLRPPERGRASGVMSAARYGGILAGGPALAAASALIGWPAVATAAALLVLAPLPLVLVLREPPARARAPGLLLIAIRALIAPGAAAAIPLALLSGASSPLIYPVAMQLLGSGLGLDRSRASVAISVGAVLSAAGAVLGGACADRWGRHRVLAVAAVALAASHAGFAAAAPLWGITALIVYQVAAGLAGGALAAVAVALYMDLVDARVTATQFQVYMALAGLRTAWAGMVGGFIGARLSAPTCFLAGAAVELTALALLPLLRRRR